MRKTARHIIDVFCGAGGMSLGACRAGFTLAGAIDVSPRALAVHSANFPKSKHIEADVADLRGDYLLASLNLRKGDLDGLVGGSPCQGFSTMGHRHPDDARNSLFRQFFRMVEELRPRFYVAENVPGILDDTFADIRASALSTIPSDYTVLPPLMLKASDFGAATSRLRVFFMGYLRDDVDGLCAENFAPAEEKAFVDVGTALRGLPKRIDPDWQTEEDGWHRLTSSPPGDFGRKTDSVIPVGAGNAVAIRRLREDRLVSGCQGTRHTREVVKRFTALEPGQVDEVSRATRLSLKGLCPTLRSGTGPERGSFQALRPIHPTEPRVITPREAARLQGFPDWFLFDATKWHSFRLIGNSVSPLLAEAILAVFWRKGR